MKRFYPIPFLLMLCISFCAHREYVAIYPHEINLYVQCDDMKNALDRKLADLERQTDQKQSKSRISAIRASDAVSQ